MLYNIDFTFVKNQINKFDNAIEIPNHVSIDEIKPRNIIIDEGIPNHFVQILFILREFNYNNEAFLPFTKTHLKNLVNNDMYIYKENTKLFSGEFVEEFPSKINIFIDLFCKKFS